MHVVTIIYLLVGFCCGYFKKLVYVFAIVLFHECGHLFMIKVFGRKVTSVEILPFGGLVKMDSLISEDIFEDLLIAVGGVFFQTLLGFSLVFLYRCDFISQGTFEFINSYNIFIILFNLVPICPLDGYKIFKLLGELVLPFKAMYKVSIIVSFLLISCFSLMKFELMRGNAFVVMFIVFMCIEEVRNEPLVMNRFYLERLNRIFKYERKNIRRKEDMYKNRTNYVRGVHEKEVLKRFFSDKIN